MLDNLPPHLKRVFQPRRYLVPILGFATIAMPLSLGFFERQVTPIDGTQTLVFLRHAEKPDQGMGQLNCQGLNRALDLSTTLPERFGNADYVFAANPLRHVEEGSQDQRYSYIRPLMTIGPSAIRLGLPVNIDFGANDTDELADEFLREQYHNATVYTAWSRGYLPELINAVAGKVLGEERMIVEDWRRDDFDTLYVLTLTWRDGKARLHSQSLHQGLDHRESACPT
ncbi:histidine phosphatase family protein [Pseudomonas protegens]|uniref:histidine phosphatase family protein n=1 Tax=Pseudomonas TaxID=286 RepID=UPI000F4C81F3|nr:histidine phosphatase family protein [Pseudomonas protegens]ROL76558.1 histidine phosphatase family protein [Pseudomonas protegens]